MPNPNRFLPALADLRQRAISIVSGLLLLALAPLAALAAGSPFGVDAPELAPAGPYPVGVRQLRFIDPARPVVLEFNAERGEAPRRDRTLVVDFWYPAAANAPRKGTRYDDSLPGEKPGSQIPFTMTGDATRDVPAAGKGYPLVIISHGWSNTTSALAWLAENLASKGYVVAAIRHQDASIVEAANVADPVLNRPLDIAFVARQLTASLGGEGLVDPKRTALVGYSIGGYGVLTAAGASLDPAGAAVTYLPGKLLAPYARGNPKQAELVVPNLRAVVAISPAGGGPLGAWGPAGVADIRCPLFLISGDQDLRVDYKTGARSFFDWATAADRYLLTYHGAGHSIGFGPAPVSMRGTLWDLDWFDDPVWRKDRVLAIHAHFITAFLDRYVRDDLAKADYLNVAVTESSRGEWPDKDAKGYADFSPGTGGITVWKGFQRKHASALELLHAAPSGTSP